MVTTHNTNPELLAESVRSAGGGLSAVLDIPRAELERAFGPAAPSPYIDGKSTSHWVICDEFGLLSVYDYCGREWSLSALALPSSARWGLSDEELDRLRSAPDPVTRFAAAAASCGLEANHAETDTLGFPVVRVA